MADGKPTNDTDISTEIDEGNFGVFSYLASIAKILYDTEKLEQFVGFSVYTNNETARQIEICGGDNDG